MAIAPLKVLPVKLVLPNKVTNVASLAATQALLELLRVCTCPSSVSYHISFGCIAEPSALVVGALLLLITLAASAPSAFAADISPVSVSYPGKLLKFSLRVVRTAPTSTAVAADVPSVSFHGPGTLATLTNLTQ